MAGTPAPGLIIAAPGSGAGKTTLTLALLRHYARAGLAVSPAKAGPDYIDPAFHRAACGRACVNLDPWAMRRETLAGLVAQASSDAQLVLCEGVMGLFDGALIDGNASVGSTAELAMLTGWAVVLVVNVRGQGGSAAALVRGFAHHDADVAIAGVIFNRVAGDRHASMIATAMAAALPHMPIIGMMPRDEALDLPERHLGLVQAGEHGALDIFLDRAADIAAKHLDTDMLRAAAAPATETGARPMPLAPLGQRIAVARDEAFAFAYGAVLQGWRDEGADIAFFSPLADEAPPADADAVYLPGGYPELHGARLAANMRFLDGLRGAARRGAAIYGECGGYMVLGETLIDADGAAHEMAGLLTLATSFAEPRLHLGYRQLETLAPSPLGKAGARFRGHEFHYAAIQREDGATRLLRTTNAAGGEAAVAGLATPDGRIAGSFIHLIDRAD